jgi:2-polyprenyl-3-methyl-5-hydroxy-6-metoxy-1,4-benzoquinol methylase
MVPMKRVSVALLVIVLQAAASGQQAPGRPDADSDIREHTEQYFDAIDRRDAKALDGLLVDECLVFYPRGVTDTKATLLAALRKSGPAAGAVPWKHTLSDVKVRRVGDTAVLTALLAVNRGDAPAVSNRRTLTWARQAGSWRLVHDQWSLLGDAQEAEFWSEYFRGNNRVFNRNPSAVLVQAVAGVSPGKALDVGVGQGRNAIYLAKQGWEVTGIDRAAGALAVTRQEAAEQSVKVTPILQSAAEFDWGHERWDLIALLYVPAVRENVAKVRASLKPGGLVVIEAFVVAPASRTGGVEYHAGELRKLFEQGFEILRYEETKGTADYGLKPTQLVRLVGRKTTAQPSSCCRTSEPAAAPSKGFRGPSRRVRRVR